MTGAAPTLMGTLTLDWRGRPDALLAVCPWCERHHGHGPADLTATDLGVIEHREVNCGGYKAAASPIAHQTIAINVAAIHRGGAQPAFAHPVIARRGWRLHERLAAPDRAAIRAEGRKRSTNAARFIDEWAGTSLRREVVRAMFGRAGGWEREVSLPDHVVMLTGWRRWRIESTSKSGRRRLGAGRDLAGLVAAVTGLSIAEVVAGFLGGFDPTLSTDVLAQIAAVATAWDLRGRSMRRSTDPADVWFGSTTEKACDDLARHPPGFGKVDGIDAPIDPADVLCRAGIACARRAMKLAAPGAGRLTAREGVCIADHFGGYAEIEVAGVAHDFHGPVAILAALYNLPAGIVIVRVIETAFGVRLDREAALTIAEVAA